MAEIVYLDIEAERPDLAEEQPWLFIEESSDGLFFGSGSARKSSGDWVGYASLSENDRTLQLALAAAREWAERYSVPTIWVFANAVPE